MLEKIGLPAKPSMRGGNWVLDASHCQGCSSQFTFINRKHHCRRCGGLFCNNCTLQRMVLRGQGDAPVRICEPCKKLEEAARFELRYGHRKRIGKGSTKQVPKNEDEVIGQILGTDGKHVSEHESDVAMIVDLQRATSSASCSDFREESAAFGSEGDIVRSMSVDAHNHGTGDISGDPEELRQQAVEEKRKYKILKGEGKSEEALRAFKRGKELERQASALEIALRKNRRMASKASNFATVARIEKIDDDEETGVKQKLTSRMVKESKGDLASELRELGWSETDLHDSENKHAKLSLEGELSNLLREATQRPSQGLKKGSIDKSEVIALKKRALLLKKEGKLAEAKEELKKAKILEKKIEEQELLGEDEDSDDELYALIRGMDEDKKDELALDHASEAGFRFDSFLVSEDLPTDGNFEVTDGDMHDPELAATLKAFGWSDEEEEQVTSQGEQLVTFDREAVRNQVLSLKREAVSQKRAGNISEAMELLKKAKLLEKELECLQDSSATMVSDSNRKNSSPQVHADAVQSVQNENAAETMSSNFRAPPKSKLTIQKELLALKKKALTLRREGRIDEAEEELKKGKVLEQQLEEMESASSKHEGELRKGKFLESQQEQIEIDPRKAVAKAGWKNLDSTHLHESGDRSLVLGEETLESEVTEQDMHDPALLSLLNNLGWKEDDNVESVRMTITTSKQMNDQSERGNGPFVASVKVKRSKADIQKELLAIKRKALALRRQGKTEESEEELEKAKALENQIAEMEVSSNANFVEVNSLGFDKQQASQDAQNSSGNLASFAVNLRIPENEVVPLPNVPDVCVAVKEEKTSALESFVPAPEIADIMKQMSGRSGLTAEGVPSITPQSNQTRESFGGLSRKDDKALQSLTGDPLKIRDTDINIFSITGSHMKPGVEDIPKEKMRSPVHQVFQSEQRDAGTNNRLASPEQKLADGVDVLRDEILSHKRKAVALKREGKLVEAREELRQAKLLEKNLEDGQQTLVVKEVASVSVESTHDKKEHKTSSPEKPLSGRDRFKIQQQSLSHKRNALKLRRAGKIDESEAELELAKALEKQLEEFDQGSSSNKSDAMDDVGVEDLLDPQLISALKAIGLDDAVDTSPPQKKTEPQPILDRSSNLQVEKANLEEQIKAEKLRALNFKREGKQAEALEALRSAKRLEKKLASLN